MVPKNPQLGWLTQCFCYFYGYETFILAYLVAIHCFTPMQTNTHNLHDLNLMREVHQALDAGQLSQLLMQFKTDRACGACGIYPCKSWNETP